MKYLNMYCEEFNLRLNDNLIIDELDRVVGYVESNKKYIKFNTSENAMKESDLLMLVLEKFSVH